MYVFAILVQQIVTVRNPSPAKFTPHPHKKPTPTCNSIVKYKFRISCTFVFELLRRLHTETTIEHKMEEVGRGLKVLIIYKTVTFLSPSSISIHSLVNMFSGSFVSLLLMYGVTVLTVEIL